MIGALYSGISGLNGFQNALDTESNNISNVNTVGFKSDKISFSDLMYQKSVGMGVNTETIDKNFKQGSLKNTDAPYDMAIEGKGFFMVTGNTDEVLFTRAGDFRMGEDGTLQMPNGYKVQGISATIASINATDAQATAFTDEYSNFVASEVIKSNDGSKIENINVKITNYTASAVNDEVTNPSVNYKTKEAKIADIELLKSAFKSELNLYSSSQIEGVKPTEQKSVVSYDLLALVNENDSIEITIGNDKIQQEFNTNAQNTLNLFANKISSIKGMSASVDLLGELTISSMVPGKNINISDAKINNSINASTSANINTTSAEIGSGKQKLDAIELALKNAVEKADAKYLQQTTTIDTTSQIVGEIQLKLDSLGYTSDSFGEPEVVDGIIYMSQGGNKFAIAKVATSVFANEYDLDPRGGNIFSKTTASGEPIMAKFENSILSKTLELSNSELSENLVNLMVFQRSFEASSKSITTSDEFLKTALALKK